MKLLALDTSSDACSVALRVDDEILAEHEVRPKEHSALLIPMIRDLLQRAGIALADLDALVLGNGPGSFIGMRIAASVAQGICFGSGLQIVPVSSLAAVAAQATQEHDVADVIVAQDARMNEVYLCRFTANGDRLPVAVTEELLHPVARLQIPDLDSKAAAAGLGWQRYPELLASNDSAVSYLDGLAQPNARYLLGLGARDWRLGRTVAPEALVPAYIRMQVAEAPSRRD